MSQEIDEILKAARIKGRNRIKALIDEAGGLLTTEEAVLAAGLWLQALLAQKDRSILAVPTKAGIGWPRFQFESVFTLRAIGQVLKCLDVTSPWMRLTAFR